MAAKPIRLDQRLVQEGLAPSRERAKALITAGAVHVNEMPVTKVAARISPGASLKVKMPSDNPDWASRGALKLAPAMDAFGVDPKGAISLDIGASTGGFTDVLLRRGAARVYAVDVGYGQLAWKLRDNPRVVVLERVNARNLSKEHVPEPVSIVVVDVSFISVTLLLPAILTRLSPGAQLLVMVKPQFEAGRGRVGKGGVVRDEALRQSTIERVAQCAVGLGLCVRGQRDNDIRGPKGNLETFLHLELEPV